MTTTVTVKTHDWPVEIKTIDQAGAGQDAEYTETIGPNSEHSAYLTQSRSLTFTELPSADQKS